MEIKVYIWMIIYIAIQAQLKEFVNWDTIARDVRFLVCVARLRGHALQDLEPPSALQREDAQPREGHGQVPVAEGALLGYDPRHH